MDSPGSPPSTATPIDIDAVEDNVSELGYLDTIDNSPPLGTQAYFMTLTFPGGITGDHLARLYSLLQRGAPDGPSFYVGTIEGGDGSTHKHVHLVVWESAQRRTDSVSRSYRNQVYSADDIAQCDRTGNLVLTRKVSDLAGCLKYLFKGQPVQHLSHYKLPPGVDFDRAVEAAQRHQASYSAGAHENSSVFPLPGKLKSIPPSQVCDYLVKAAAELEIDVSLYNTFGLIVHHCYRRGVRFDLSKLKSYRIGLEMLVTPTESSRSKVLQHELEWRSSN